MASDDLTAQCREVLLSSCKNVQTHRRVHQRGVQVTAWVNVGDWVQLDDAAACMAKREARLVAQRDVLVAALEVALGVLPDSVGGDDWKWCWDELDDASQDAVKTTRQQIAAALAAAQEAP